MNFYLYYIKAQKRCQERKTHIDISKIRIFKSAALK